MAEGTHPAGTRRSSTTSRTVSSVTRSEPAPGLLPGELRPAPVAVQVRVIAVILVVVTAIEIAISYLEGDIPDGLIVALLLVDGGHQVRRRSRPSTCTCRPTSRSSGGSSSWASSPRSCCTRSCSRPCASSDEHRSGLTWSVPSEFPAWQPQPDVWLLVAGLAVGYWIAVVRVGPRFVAPGRPVVTRFQVTCCGLGVLAMLARGRLADPRRRRAA